MFKIAHNPAMTKRAYDKIAEGLKEAIAVARGEKPWELNSMRLRMVR